MTTQGIYLMEFKSERIAKQMNAVMKKIFKVWDSEETREEYLSLSEEYERLADEYFKELAKEGIVIPQCTIDDILKNQD